MKKKKKTEPVALFIFNKLQVILLAIAWSLKYTPWKKYWGEQARDPSPKQFFYIKGPLLADYS